MSTAIGSPGVVDIGTWLDELNSSRRLAIVAMGLAGFIHMALIVRRDAPSEDAVVAGLGWLLVVLRFACSKDTRPNNAALAGVGILLFGLIQTARLETCDLWFSKALPFFLFGGILLQVSSAVDGLRCHWRSIAILVTMVPAPHIEFFLETITYLTLFHAKAAAFLLYYLGNDIGSHGMTLSLPAGSVDVHPGCSGQPLMFLLLRIGLIFCLAIPIRWRVRLTIFLGAVAMGAVTGIIRIATLAAAVQNPHWFEGIHGWYGGSFFTALGILLFAPFLIPFEKPLADLLRICRANWDSSGAGGSRQCLRISIAGLLGFASAFCLVNRMGDRDGDGRPELIGWKALEFAPTGSRAIQVPDKLRANRFGLVKGARLWRATTGGENWTVLVCPISNGLVGPHDLLLSGLWDNFLLQQFPNVFPLPSDIVWKKTNVSTNAKGGIIGIAKTPRGAVAVVGVNPEGEAFFDSDDYSATQRAALSQWQTWERWFTAGNPLKNSRYQLVIIALDCDPA